ncbi:MAG: site-2 protease family protein [Candidatus Thermoplasmatota archaeon]|nr:site-2 protease family protein [Candidatus Thermoplasmatota archaeon]
MTKRPENYSNEIDFIQDVVSQYFPIYKTKVEFDIVSVYIKTSIDETLENKFDELRSTLVPQNFVPYLVEENGEHIIKVNKQEEKNYRGLKANLVMLLVTLGTTLIAGAWWWSSYSPAGEGMFSLHNISRGALFFTLPLMSILGIHEMGHYIMARYHGIKASLPFFLPMAPPLGTIGAFISIREPIPDKKSLLDVGIAGPIAGFIVAIPVSLIGLYLGATTTPTAPIAEEGIRYIWNFPIILRGMSRFIPFSAGETIHPTLFAGWVGFLVTGLNLLPASQLDGGHVVRSLFGKYSKYISYVAFGFLIIVGIWQYIGWVVFAFLILFLGGVKHPPPLNDITELDKKRFIVGGLAIMILLVSFHPVPVEQESFSYGFDVKLADEPGQELVLNESFNYTLMVENEAENVNIDDGIDYNVSYSMSNQSWDSRLFKKSAPSDNESEWEPVKANATDLNLDMGENQTYRLNVRPTVNSSFENRIEFKVTSNVTKSIQKETRELFPRIGHEFESRLPGGRFSLIKENQTEFEFSLSNRGLNDTYEVTAEEISDKNWTVEFYEGTEETESLEENLSLDLSYAEEVNFTARLHGGTQQEGELTVITFKVTIESKDTGERRAFEVMGIMVNE